MGYDRFIKWEPGAEEIPSQEEVEQALRRYIYDGGYFWQDGSTWFVNLPGEPRYVFREWADDEAWERGGTSGGQRGFEVYYNGDDPKNPYVDVITRGQDEFTQAVAEGFVNLIVFRWKGRREE